CCTSRTQLRTQSTGSRPRTLSRCVGAQTGRAGGRQTPARMAPARAVAGEVRPATRCSVRPARKNERGAPDEPVGESDEAARTPARALRDRSGAFTGLFRRRRDPASGANRRSGACARNARRGGRALTLRTSAAGADRLRPAARPGGRVMSTQSAVLEAATIRQQCKALHLPSVASQCAQLAEQAARERHPHRGYREARLEADPEDREQGLVGRRLRDAHLPRMKTLEEFNFSKCPSISAHQIHELARGDYLVKAEPVIFIGESGTGKTHLLTGLAVAACRQKRRVGVAPPPPLVDRTG